MHMCMHMRLQANTRRGDGGGNHIYITHVQIFVRINTCVFTYTCICRLVLDQATVEEIKYIQYKYQYSYV